MKSQIKSSFVKQFVFQTIISIIIYTFFFICIFYFSYLFFSIKTWEKTDVIYIVLNFIRQRTIFIYILGILTIIIYYWNKTFKYIVKIEKETKKIVDNENALITLPNELKSIETSLNHVKKQSIKNKSLAIIEQQKTNELVACLAHDLKTPLTSIIGYLDLLLQKKELDENEKIKYLNLIMNKSLSLQYLINELFEITKLHIKDIKLKKEEINIFELISQIVQDFYPVSFSKEKSIDLKIPNEKVFVYGDKIQLTRAFNNLIKNAISYSLPKTTIVIDYDLPDNSVNINIKNKCPKLTPEELNNIFEKFYRCDLSRNSENGGSGLGLSIAKEIIELHNGSITVKQETDTFELTVKIPILIES